MEENTQEIAATVENGEEQMEQEVTEVEMSVEERLAQLEVENKRLKSAVDKTSSEAADYKKKWKESKTVSEQAAIEKAEKEAEREEQFQKLVKENTVNKYKAQFIGLGYSPEQAGEAANAQYENDTDALFDIQNKFLDEKQKAMKAELMKTMPMPPTSNNSDTDPFIAGFDS